MSSISSTTTGSTMKAGHPTFDAIAWAMGAKSNDYGDEIPDHDIIVLSYVN